MHKFNSTRQLWCWLFTHTGRLRINGGYGAVLLATRLWPFIQWFILRRCCLAAQHRRLICMLRCVDRVLVLGGWQHLVQNILRVVQNQILHILFACGWKLLRFIWTIYLLIEWVLMQQQRLGVRKVNAILRQIVRLVVSNNVARLVCRWT